MEETTDREILAEAPYGGLGGPGAWRGLAAPMLTHQGGKHGSLRWSILSPWNFPGALVGSGEQGLVFLQTLLDQGLSLQTGLGKTS